MAATLIPRTDERRVVRPQDGPQLAFLSTEADIAIYGGAAGGGKSWALLLEPLRHVSRPDFASVFFRRSTVQIRNPGGLWDESLKLYPSAGATPISHVIEWRFPSGCRVKFAHLEHEKTVLEWQGAQVPLICFDELTHFTESQFWYMVSRNRSMTGIRPYIRATCNPDADSWVAKFIEWWIDQDTGLPIPERAGVIRWFIRINDTLVWGGSQSELDALHPGVPAKSMTFIPAKLSDNVALTTADPTYEANLMALPRVERERLLGGNWKIRPAAGLYFQKGWFEVVDAIPAGGKAVRCWDIAATQETGKNDPDYTVGVKAVRVPDLADPKLGTFYVTDVRRERLSPAGVERLIMSTASQDGKGVPIRLPQDPAAAGKTAAHTYVKMLAGYIARAELVTGSKEVRAGPASAQAEIGNVKLLRGPWNAAFLDELEAFPIGAHDDQCFVAGTMIATARGDVPIEDVVVGDSVWTRAGLRRVSASGMTNAFADVIRAEMSDGRRLVGTPGHPVWIDDVGFVRLDATPGVGYISVCQSACQPTKSRPSFSTGSRFADTRFRLASTISDISRRAAVTFAEAWRRCTGKYGNTTTGQSRPVTTSTIRTTTRSTTTSPIWLRFFQTRIGLNTSARESGLGPVGSARTWTRFAPWLRLGTQVMRAGPGIQSTPGWPMKPARPANMSALSAATGSSQSTSTPHAKTASGSAPRSAPPSSREVRGEGKQPSHASFATPNFRGPRELKHARVSVLRTIAGLPRAAVFNLSVEGENEYFANGILVHNCDAFADAINELALGSAYNIGALG